MASEAILHQHHRLPVHFSSSYCLLLPACHLPAHRKVHHSNGKFSFHHCLWIQVAIMFTRRCFPLSAVQRRDNMVSWPLHVHHLDERVGAAVEWHRHRGLVAQRAVLGHRRRVRAPVRRVPGYPQDDCRAGHQLHGHGQGDGRHRVRRSLRVQVDDGADPADHHPGAQPGGRGGRVLGRAQQRLRVVGPALRQGVLRHVGDHAPVPVPQGSHGPPEPHAHHRRALVRPARLRLLPPLGQDRPLRRRHRAYQQHQLQHSHLLRGRRSAGGVPRTMSFVFLVLQMWLPGARAVGFLPLSPLPQDLKDLL